MAIQVRAAAWYQFQACSPACSSSKRRIDFPTYTPPVSRASDYDGTRVGYTREEPDQHSGTYTSRQIESTEAWSQGG
jgi:hypothetical protein